MPFSRDLCNWHRKLMATINGAFRVAYVDASRIASNKLLMDYRLDRDEECLVRVVNLYVRVLAETLVSEFHMGQQADQPASTGRT